METAEKKLLHNGKHKQLAWLLNNKSHRGKKEGIKKSISHSTMHHTCWKLVKVVNERKVFGIGGKLRGIFAVVKGKK
jgi:hypothetical protein